MSQRVKAEVVVVGAGPGGYAAAFYAADKGKSVVLVDSSPALGGVCLNRGCIPSKALLHAAEVLRESESAVKMGITFGRPSIDLDKLRKWKDSVLKSLNQGIKGLADMRKVTVITGRGHFEGSNVLRVESEKGQQFVEYDKAIISVGSRPAMPAAFDLGNKRIMTSTEALDLEDIPKKLLIVGGGYIGMELGTFYSAIGSKITVVEAMDQILVGADPDLVRPVRKFADRSFSEIRLNTKVLKMATKKKQIEVKMDMNGKEITETFDRVLVSVGRTPNSDDLGLENTGVVLDSKGFIQVNQSQQTDDPSILAIGDISGGLLLAHKASKEARVAVDTILGDIATMKDVVIPAVVFTDPEVAWCGLTETEAKEKGIDVKVSKFNWTASGRALSINHSEGCTKLIVDPISDRLLGVGIVGKGAGDLIGEAVLALEMGATATDIAESVHPHQGDQAPPEPSHPATRYEADEAYQVGHAKRPRIFPALQLDPPIARRNRHQRWCVS